MIVRMSRHPEGRWDEMLMQRYLPVHWRFQELLGFPEDRSLDGIYDASMFSKSSFGGGWGFELVGVLRRFRERWGWFGWGRVLEESVEMSGDVPF